MANEIIHADKDIEKFPVPYDRSSTPFVQTDFSQMTYEKSLYEQQKNNTAELLNISKVIIIGDVSVGKTCIINRFCKKMFETNYKSTIGVDFEVEKFKIIGIPFYLQIWDTAGQERFKSIAQSYYRGAHAIIIVFDLSDPRTLLNIKNWLMEALNANIGKDPFVFLVGTKRDLINSLEYKNIKWAAVKLAAELEAEYWSVSSKTGKNIAKLFARIAAITFDEYMCKQNSVSSKINIGTKLINSASLERNSSSTCCVRYGKLSK